MADILTEALNGANKTRIIYRANLNFLRFDRYLSEILDKGLIAEKNTSFITVYQTTDEGKRFLKVMREARSLMRKAEEIILV